MELLLRLPWIALEGMWMMITLFAVFIVSSSLAWKAVALVPILLFWWAMKNYGRDD